MDIITEGVDAQNEAAGQMDLDVEMDQARNGGAIQGIWGIDLENAYGWMFRSQALKWARHRAPQHSGDGSYAVVRWRKSYLVPGRGCVEKLMDGTWWMARSSQRAASLCDEPGGSGGQRAGHG